MTNINQIYCKSILNKPSILGFQNDNQAESKLSWSLISTTYLLHLNYSNLFDPELNNPFLSIFYIPFDTIL